MNEYAFILAIAGALLAGAMSPGPSFLVVAQNSLSKSRVHGVATAVGTGLGAAVFAFLAAVGVTALLAASPKFYLGFRLVGGVYLLFLAYLIYSAAKSPLAIGVNKQGTDKGLYFSLLKGFLIQVSNPKTVFIIASIFSAILPAQVPEGTAIIVTVVAFVVDFAWYALVAIALSNERCKQFYVGAKQYFDYFASILLVFLGMRLLVDVLA